MKIGCGEWGLRERPIKDHFELARSLGFRTLEFGIGGDFPGRLPATLNDTGVAHFRSLAIRHGLETAGCCLENDFTLLDATAHAANVRRTLQEMHLAQRCGAKQVRLFAGFTPVAQMTEAIWQRLADGLHQAATLAAELSLTVAIETHGRITTKAGVAHHEHTVTTDPSALTRLIRQLPPCTGFNWDPGNLKAVAPTDRTCALPLLNSHINYCHLKDWRRQGDGWIACAIGDDDLDYGALLPQVRFDGVYLIEYEPTHDVEAGILRSLTYLKKLGLTLSLT